MKKKRLRILITAAGGDLGQAVIKALKLSPSAYEFWGSDLHEQSAASIFVDRYVRVPRASDPHYRAAVNKLCSRYKIQAVIPCSEAEILALAQEGSRLESGSALVCQSRFWLETYGDKLRCMQSLQGKARIAPFADGADAQAVAKLVKNCGFPLVVKPRRSSGSRAVQIAQNHRQLKKFLARTAEPLVQQFLDEHGGEFSACVFRSKSFETVIAFRRELGPAGLGCSWSAEVSNDPEVLAYSKKLARETGLRGSANFQMRKTSKGIRLLEINPRFSSLVHARAACGFQDADWSVKQALGLPFKKPAEYKFLRYQRFFSEALDFGRGFAVPKAWVPKTAGIKAGS